MTSVPAIDLRPFLSGDAAARTKVAGSIDQACREIGFFQIQGHGIEAELIDAAMRNVAAFFRLPAEEKALIRQPSPEIARGYTPFKGETLSAGLGEAAPADLKEMIDIGPVDVPGGPYYEAGGAHFAPNLWPVAPVDFRRCMETYYRRMNVLADSLMEAFALALDLPLAFFRPKLDRNMSALRLICYPEQPEAPEPGQLRGGAHTDYGTLTLLTSDRAAGGLQARHRDGYWVDVVIEPGSFIVNIGDIMQIWTNDRWVSTLHRVANPPADQAMTRRHSLVFFHQPNYDAEIEVLASCCGPDAPPRYTPLTYRQHWLGKWMATKS